jgi:hypothetical protein
MTTIYYSYKLIFLLISELKKSDVDFSDIKYRVYSEDNTDLIMSIESCNLRNKAIITLKTISQKAIIQSYGALEPTPYNLTHDDELLLTTYIDNEDESKFINKIAIAIVSALNSSSKYTKWIEAGNKRKIVAVESKKITDLHESCVCFKEVNEATELKYEDTLTHEIKIHTKEHGLMNVQKCTEAAKRYIKQNNNPLGLYFVYNNRGQTFLYTPIEFFKLFEIN